MLLVYASNVTTFLQPMSPASFFVLQRETVPMYSFFSSYYNPTWLVCTLAIHEELKSDAYIGRLVYDLPKSYNLATKQQNNNTEVFIWIYQP